MKMRMKTQSEVEVDVRTLHCILPVDYDEEDMPSDYPHRKGDMWDVRIDVETGQIQDWPGPREALDLYMKVVDGGRYYLLDGAGQRVVSIEDDYVPRGIPGAYGDYVNFKIDGDGRITNWSFDAERFLQSVW